MDVSCPQSPSRNDMTKTPQSLGRRTVVLGLALVCSGCGNLPQPFRRDANSTNPLLANPSGAGVGVVPVAGLPPEAGTAIADRIAALLQNQEVPAESVDRVGVLGFTLEGNLNTLPRGLDGSGTSIDWRLVNRQGEVVQRFEQALPFASSEIERGSDWALEQVANDMGQRVLALIAPQLDVVVETPPPPPWTGAAVLIRPPTGAPGDENIALGRALAARFGQAGLVPAEGRMDFIVTGEVVVQPFDGELDDISISWSVLTPDEQVLGDVRLDNRVPRQQLRTSWRAIAEAVTDAALPGLLDIMSAALR